MKILGRIHETLIRRVDKNNLQSDYYEIYPITTADAVYMDQNEDSSLLDFLSEMRHKYNIYIENIRYPVNSVQVYNGSQFGEIKKGDVLLSSKDFGLDLVDNTPDILKPVSDPQKKYIETYTQGIIDDIHFIMGNAGVWNSHILDMNNPHRVTWEQVTNNSPINPEDLVDHQAMQSAIDTHNASTDLTTLHPYLTNQLKTLQTSLTEIQNQLNTSFAELEASIKSATDTSINAHNTDPSSHPHLITLLADMQTQITNILDEYSGLTGVEYTANRVDEPDIEKVYDVSDTTYDGMYPSMNALSKLIFSMQAYGFPSVDHVTDITPAALTSLANEKKNGILFADRLSGVGGSYIYVYQRQQVIVSYALPDPVPNAQFAIMNNAPTAAQMESTYGDGSVIVFCNHASAYSDLQSVVCWYNHTWSEFVIDVFRLGAGENLYSAEYAYYEPGSVASLFPTGHGILFVERMNTTQLPGVILYNVNASPQTRRLEYGYKVEEPAGRSAMRMMRAEPLPDPAPSTMVETVPFRASEDGQYVHQFSHPFLEKPEAIVVLSGMQTSDTTSDTITAEAVVSEVTDTQVTISYRVSGVTANFTIYITGKVQ